MRYCCVIIHPFLHYSYYWLPRGLQCLLPKHSYPIQTWSRPVLPFFNNSWRSFFCHLELFAGLNLLPYLLFNFIDLFKDWCFAVIFPYSCPKVSKFIDARYHSNEILHLIRLSVKNSYVLDNQFAILYSSISCRNFV